MSDAIISWTVQLRKGAADFAVLSLIKHKPRSGSQILEAMESYPSVGIAEGSIYPLLSRLEREGTITGAWHPSETGTRNQKIYNLTPMGAELLYRMNRVWSDFSDQLTRISAT